MKTTSQSFIAMDNRAVKNNTPRPYMFDKYNVKFYWKSFTSSGIESPLTRVYNAFVEGINANSHLPKTIVMMPDVNLLRCMVYYKFGASLVIGKVIGNWVNKIIVEVNDRFNKLKAKRTGAIVPGEPKFLWVGILDRPKPDKILSQRRKYN